MNELVTDPENDPRSEGLLSKRSQLTLQYPLDR